MSYLPKLSSENRFGGSLFIRCLTAMLLMVTAIGLMSQRVYADAVATGTIEGRVLNLNNGRYLSKASVKVEGTSNETFTNDYGEYQLYDVPAGNASITVAYTGLESKTVTIAIEAGKTASKDFGLSAAKTASGTGEETLVLDQYVVATQRYKSAAEIATNEERHSVNLKDVVATDSLGHIPSGNVGEFVKYIPGVQAEYGSSDAFSGAGMGGVNPAAASQISIRGFGSAETAVMIDGVPVSAVGPAQLTTAVSLDMMSINNASRVEVVKVPTPDMQISGAGGVVNLVTKSAFEYSKPTYMVEVSATYNTADDKVFSREPGPTDHPTYHTQPNFAASVAVPVSKNFGFTVSMAMANSYSANYSVKDSWQSTYSTQYGSTRAPSTTTYGYLASWTTTTSNGTKTTTWYNVGNLDNGNLSDITNPFLKGVQDEQNPWSERRMSAGLKLDWKPVNGLTLTASYTGSTYKGLDADRRLEIDQKGPMEWGPGYVIGRPSEAASGTLSKLDAGNGLQQEVTTRDKSGFTQTGYVKATYTNGPWSGDMSAAISHTTVDLDDMKNGHFYDLQLSETVNQSVLTNIDGDGVPHGIQLYDKNNNLIDYKHLANWALSNTNSDGSLNVGTAVAKQRDDQDEVGINLRRELDFLPINVAIKVGGKFSQENQSKSGKGTGYKIRYIGGDANTSTFLSSITEDNFMRSSGLGFAQDQEWASTYKLYQIYVQNPSLFTDSYDVTYVTNNYKEGITSYRKIKDNKDSYYAQLEWNFFHNRLSVVTGAVQSVERMSGYQPYYDTNWNYIKNPDGSIYIDSVYTTGVKINTWAPRSGVTGGYLTDTALLSRLAAAGIDVTSPQYNHVVLSQLAGSATADGTTGVNLEAMQRYIYTKRLDLRRTNPITPSVIASYNITDNLVFKPSWIRKTSLPALDSGNTAGSPSLLGTFTISPLDPPTSDLGGEGTITVNNPGLKPRVDDEWDFQLAYYTKYGKIAATYFYTTIKNEWVTTTVYSGSPLYSEILADLGLDPATYDNWKISTLANGDARSHNSGYEFEARENLGFLGDTMSHFNVFGNYSHKNYKQSLDSNVIGRSVVFSSNTWAAGINVSAYRASATAKVVYNDATWDSSAGQVTYQGQKVQLYYYTPESYDLRLDFDYQLTKVFSLFASAANVLNTRSKQQIRDTVGLYPTYAAPYKEAEFGVNVTTGIRASF